MKLIIQMATIIGSGPRKPPRIMARKSIVVKRLPRGIQFFLRFWTKSIILGVQGRDDETEKLKREGYEVQAGVLTVNQVLLPKSSEKSINRICFQNHPSNFKPKQLPGVANDVESYPCRFCDEKVFLTASGLEKHAKEAHVQNLDDIMTDIATISGEWKKREVRNCWNIVKSLFFAVRTSPFARASVNGQTSSRSPCQSTCSSRPRRRYLFINLYHFLITS